MCPVDTNHDGECDELEQKAFEIIVYDRATKRGVPVLVRDRPEFVDATMTGLLRREERTVDDAESVEGFDFGALDLQVSDRYVLDEPAGAGAAPLAFVLAAALAAVALVIVIGLAGGYLVYRRSAAALPAAQTTLAAGERIPLRITGVVQTPTGRLHVREVPGGLVRFVLGREVAPEAPEMPEDPHATDAPDVPESPGVADPSDSPEPVDAGEPPDGPSSIPPDMPPATTVVVERTGYPHGVELGRGQLAALSIGEVMPLRGPRPAIRVEAGTGPLLLSFDTDAERDRAAAELLGEAGLGPDGHRPMDS